MSIDLHAAPSGTGGTVGPVSFAVSYGQANANASAPAVLAQMFAQSGGTAGAISELAHILKTGQHKGGMASLAISAHAAAIAAGYGLGEHLHGGAAVMIDIADGRYSGGMQASVRVRVGRAEFHGLDPYAPKAKPVRHDTVAKIEILGGQKAEIEMPSQAEFDELRADMGRKIARGEIAFRNHVAPDQVAAALIEQIVNAKQVDERRDELVSAIGVMIEAQNPCIASSIAECRQVIFIQIARDGVTSKGTYSIHSNS
jgi:hypothetical protein